MWKKVFQLIPATLLLFCVACQGIHSDSSISDFLYSTPQAESSSSNQKEPLDPTVWDTEDIDISEINPARKLIAFTFDDAPARTAERILTVFAQFNEQNPDCMASGTFFVNGCRWDNQSPHLFHLAHSLGWELGNHTHSHADLTTLSPIQLEQEITKTDKLLQTIDGKPTHLLRAPFGRTNELVREVSKVPIIDWTIDTLDWKHRSKEEIYDSVFSQKYAGAIVLMHDGYEGTVAALKELLPDLKAAGYQAVSLSKMIKAHGCQFRRGQVYIRARKGK